MATTKLDISWRYSHRESNSLPVLYHIVMYHLSVARLAGVLDRCQFSAFSHNNLILPSFHTLSSDRLDHVISISSVREEPSLLPSWLRLKRPLYIPSVTTLSIWIVTLPRVLWNQQAITSLKLWKQYWERTKIFTQLCYNFIINHSQCSFRVWTDKQFRKYQIDWISYSAFSIETCLFHGKVESDLINDRGVTYRLIGVS